VIHNLVRDGKTPLFDRKSSLKTRFLRNTEKAIFSTKLKVKFNTKKVSKARKKQKETIKQRMRFLQQQKKKHEGKSTLCWKKSPIRKENKENENWRIMKSKKAKVDLISCLHCLS
jgi:ABC-type phosphate/phosphonate transport system ATPase subunit